MSIDILTLFGIIKYISQINVFKLIKKHVNKNKYKEKIRLDDMIKSQI